MGIEEVPKKMKAVQVIEFDKPYQLREVDVPQILGPLDLLVKVAVASNCHTDGMVQSGVFGSKLPVTASHEGAGTIVAIGCEVKDFKEGDRVMCGLPLHPCGSCHDCIGPENQKQYCTKLEGYIGIHVNGCLAEYVQCDSRSTTLLPKEVSFLSAAPLACAGRTIWRGIIQTGLKPGEWVCIVGSGGGLGHLGVQFAKAMGLKVIGIDARDEGLQLTKQHGADVVVDARKGKDHAAKQVQTITGGRGADSSICISDAPSAAALACAVTKMHGIMVQIAQPDNVEIPFRELIFRDIRIHGSLICSPEESRRMLECIAKNGVTVKTNPFDGLDKMDKLVELVKSGKIQGKAVVIVDPKQIEEERRLGAKF
ncbi:Hypothetical protein R9X50_00385700 [Acrodontium crateriforme]|uniref:Enoyl reductase (ER) domain-containing protein n=1 Tax=Acrodontium crateriforme TaxID=150365 RepID=A0AAQ3M4E0_9PEZI|nr:Hypothetical protein R9X50_00385700 [Acrodontium crateriforme]